mmetsp:Transcript_17940/g.39592  ORF Transcript_17940/g.39592 Transcript_17940/m.39592 type:complete len:225 (-) Transcript_17940:463-1137(-)
MMPPNFGTRRSQSIKLASVTWHVFGGKLNRLEMVLFRQCTSVGHANKDLHITNISHPHFFRGEQHHGQGCARKSAVAITSQSAMQPAKRPRETRFDVMREIAVPKYRRWQVFGDDSRDARAVQAMPVAHRKQRIGTPGCNGQSILVSASFRVCPTPSRKPDWQRVNVDPIAGKLAVDLSHVAALYQVNWDHHLHIAVPAHCVRCAVQLLHRRCFIKFCFVIGPG